MWRHVASNALTFFIFALFLLAGLIAWGAGRYKAPGPLAQAICLEVPSGANMRGVGKSLQDQGAIESLTIFRIGSDYSGKAGLLKAGSYLVPANAAMTDIVDIVTRGGQSTCGTEVVYRIGLTGTRAQVRELDPVTSRFEEKADFDLATEAAPDEYTRVVAEADTRFRVILAEGVTSWQAMTGLNAIDTLQGDLDSVPSEGSLAPDSYEFVPGTDIVAILARMQDAQTAILAEAWANRAADLPVTTPEEALVLASIIEKETGVPEERGLVAAVFANRLVKGIRLQTDPSVIYGVTQGQGVLGRGLRQSELERDTPYNTYVHAGLPPTPIANPGRAAIEAALHPETTEFLYFVADGTGGHAFATTLAEHNRNVAAWRVIEAERAAAAAAAESTSGN